MARREVDPRAKGCSESCRGCPAARKTMLGALSCLWLKKLACGDTTVLLLKQSWEQNSPGQSHTQGDAVSLNPTDTPGCDWAPAAPTE